MSGNPALRSVWLLGVVDGVVDVEMQLARLHVRQRRPAR